MIVSHHMIVARSGVVTWEGLLAMLSIHGELCSYGGVLFTKLMHSIMVTVYTILSILVTQQGQIVFPEV